MLVIREKSSSIKIVVHKTTEELNIKHEMMELNMVLSLYAIYIHYKFEAGVQ